MSALALTVRLVTLGTKSLWSDEAYSWYFAVLDLPSIWLTGGPDPSHPPLYYTVLHVFAQFSSSEWMLRLPSAVASAATVGLIFLIGDRLAGRRAAIVASAIAVVSPLDIWYAQEARQAALGTAFMALAAYGLIRRDIMGRVIGGLALTAAFLTYYVTILVWVFVLGITFVERREQKHDLTKEWLYVTLPAMAVFAPVQGVHFVEGFSSLRSTSAAFGGILGVMTSPFILLAVGLVAGVLSTLIVKVGIANFRIPTVSMILGGFALVVVFTPVERLYSIKRIIVVGWPMVILLVSVLVATQLARKTSCYAAVSLVALSSLASVVTLGVDKDDWQTAILLINSASEAGDVIWVHDTGPWVPAPFVYYGTELPVVLVEDPELEHRHAAPMEGDIWMVAPRSPRDPIPSTAHEAWLDSNWMLIDDIAVHRKSVRRYERDWQAASGSPDWRDPSPLKRITDSASTAPGLLVEAKK